MFPLLPPPPLSPSFFFRARWRIMAEKPKESMWSGRSWRRREARQSHPFLAFLCFFYSSIHLFIHHHCITPVLFPTHGLPWFSSVLSWHVASECIMCWFIAKLRRHTSAVAEINPSDPVVMRLQVVWGFFVCIFLSRECLCVCCHGTVITLPPLKMGSCAPFWQCCAGPGAWLCAMLMVSLRARRKMRVRETRDKWSREQMNSEMCTY